MRHFILIALTLAILAPASAQESWKPGRFMLGMRTTVSTFGHDGYTGLGFGGQFRVMLSNRINTEWFADYISNNLGGYGRRNDGHIGWSVMFYPLATGKPVTPYLLAGHCFDYTSITVSNAFSSQNPAPSASRFSSAVQAGIGAHIRLDHNLDFSLSSQYMSHLGKDLHLDYHNHDGIQEAHIDKSNAILEGHVLFTASLNLKIAQLWKSKS